MWIVDGVFFSSGMGLSLGVRVDCSFKDLIILWIALVQSVRVEVNMLLLGLIHPLFFVSFVDSQKVFFPSHVRTRSRVESWNGVFLLGIPFMRRSGVDFFPPKAHSFLS